ncbi:MDR family MFS transporter [Asticcacaulis sp. 201]|uniref:MDR family MFS transporter n=1 Tax=Asticcacaulis sp. 201 TaxID=3028787 RepID=UPI002916D28B|nr:MDR family MFS transporter [Asticcacaulis sp. 201]MDV6331995.1 MDR family MFS transporter [Asticcacaulis sp. 201]
MTAAHTAASPAQTASMDPKDVQRVIIGLMMVMLLAALDQTIVSTALPTIGRELGDIEHLPWIVTAYLLSSTVVTPLYGKLADIVGRRTTLLMAIAIFLAGSALCGLANNMYLLIAARAVQGLGGGGLMSLVQTVISDVVTMKERGRLQGYFAAVFTASSLGGPVLGGFIAEKFHWSAIFWINLPFGALALWIVFKALLKLPRYERPHKLDVFGAALMAVAALCVMLALNTHGGAIYGVPVWAFYVASVVLWLLFALRLRLAPEPLIPTDVLKNGIVLRATLMSTLAMGVMMGIGIYLPIFLQIVYHLGATQTGLALVPMSLGVVAGSIGAGRYISFTKGQKYKLMPMIGLPVAACVYAVLAVFPDRLPLWGFECLLVVASAGLGTVMSVSIVAIQNVVERHQMGTATGMMNFFRSLGGALLVAAFGAILFGQVFGLMGSEASAGLTPQVLDHLKLVDHAALIFRPLFGCGAAGLCLAAITLWSMEERPIRGREPGIAKIIEESLPEAILEDADFSKKP